ncbi:MAG TPA: 30S ribosomal protein S20 [Thermoanaerobaculia bacterium]|nr:30S ribosomal protein S20 [Thermoanaerobaculia bacterium]
MANTKSAEKRMRQNAKRRERNRAARSTMRTEIKKVRTALDQGELDIAVQQLPRTVEIIDRAAHKGVIHANAAARTKSRLTRAVARASGAAAEGPAPKAKKPAARKAAAKKPAAKKAAAKKAAKGKAKVEGE